jgi:PKD repeat protein
VRATQSDGQTAERDVSDAPADCAPGAPGGGGNLPPVVDANGPYSGTPGVAITFSSAGSSDPDGSIGTWAWDFGDGGTSSAANPNHVYAAAGDYTVTLTVTDNNGSSASDATTASVRDVQSAPAVSINSTSQDSAAQVTSAVSERPKVLNSDYSVVAINDLGMHCGDYDTRIASILPPFQVLLTQVIQKGAEPVLNPAGVSLSYSAAANPADPVLNKAGVLNGLKVDGSTYKTNFWDSVAKGAYDPFYPAPLTPLSTGLAGATEPVTADVGLPVPNVENLYIGPDGDVNSGDEQLTAVQHAMPGLTNPYLINAPQPVEEHYRDKPFFVNFPFGYVANDVNWYEGAGIAFAAFDDFGRENAYPLVRVEARSGGTVLATVDTVLPISGEASCTNCHSDPGDVQNSRSDAPTRALRDAGLPVATSMDDPDPDLPHKVSAEYAADINILRLHDLKHGASYVDTANQPTPCDVTVNGGEGDASCLINKALVQQQPVVCQVCHYTPALDLAQVGPVAGAPGTDANGRNQLAHESNSRVMHNHHGQMSSLFPPMPAPIQNAAGSITNQAARLEVLEDTCYQCHPGTSTQCLRGAMFNAGMLCNDCHGDMTQVGADFSAGVSPDNPGDFQLGLGNFYDPASPQPRVPWANEPGCGSCHTGDASSNLAGTANTIVNTVDTNGNTDGIRLRQAWRSGDAKATPIVPTNKRFAEPAVPASFNGFDNPGAGNPRLYRVSTGHGGVFCEGCHGATHAEWPNANPNANDNITATQLQGHTGTIVECSTCHGDSMNGRNTLGGPHGMHPVGADTEFARGGHHDVAEHNSGACVACHGGGSRSTNTGTVLSVAKADRNLRGTLVSKGEPVGCSVCHGSGGVDD